MKRMMTTLQRTKAMTAHEVWGKQQKTDEAKG